MNKIKEIRNKLLITQNGLAKEINKTQRAVGHYESGRRNVSAKTAIEIINFFNKKGANISFEDIFPHGK